MGYIWLEGGSERKERIKKQKEERVKEWRMLKVREQNWEKTMRQSTAEKSRISKRLFREQPGRGVTHGGRCSPWKTRWTCHTRPCCCHCCCSRSTGRRLFWGSAGSWESSRYLQQVDATMFHSCIRLFVSVRYLSLSRIPQCSWLSPKKEHLNPVRLVIILLLC